MPAHCRASVLPATRPVCHVPGKESRPMHEAPGRPCSVPSRIASLLVAVALLTLGSGILALAVLPHPRVESLVLGVYGADVARHYTPAVHDRLVAVRYLAAAAFLLC